MHNLPTDTRPAVEFGQAEEIVRLIRAALDAKGAYEHALWMGTPDTERVAIYDASVEAASAAIEAVRDLARSHR